MSELTREDVVRICLDLYGDMPTVEQRNAIVQLRDTDATLRARVAELELRRSETAAMCEQLTVDLESCHTQVSTLQASDRACAEAGADNLSLRLLLADKLATVTAERDAFIAGGVTEELLRKQNGYFKVGKGCVIVREDDYRLTWTTAKPTGAGQWWYRSPTVPPFIVRLDWVLGELETVRDDFDFKVRDMAGEWAGPIALPKEVQP